MRIPLVLLPALLLAACAPRTAWTRADATVVDADRDQRQCLRVAERQAQEEYGMDVHTPDNGSLDAQRRSAVFDQQQSQLEYRAYQQRLADDCMQLRGYQQQTVPPRN